MSKNLKVRIPNAMHPLAGMTHLAILLTFGPLANSAIYHLPDNQKIPFSGAEVMDTEDTDMGKELFKFGSRQGDEMWRFINAHRHQHKVPVVRRNVCVGITRRLEQDLSMTESCNAENLSTNLADEIHYRWWPPVGHRSTPLTSQAGTGDLTFEALNRNLARKWFPAQSTGVTTTNDASDGTICSSKPEGTSSKECQGDSDPIPVGEGHPASTGRALTPESPEVRVQHNGSPTSTAESQLLFLARHGETDMNAAGKLQGRGVDAQLNGFGDRQATELGRFLRNVPFDTVTSSSLRRAFETAMCVVKENVNCVETAQKNGSPDTEKVRKHEGLDELSWGELEGQDSETEPWKGRLENLKGAWNAGHFDRAVDKGESVLEVEARARAAVEACLDNGGSLNLVVSHGRTLRILILSLTGMGLDQMKHIGKVPNTALYVIEARREAPGMPRSYHLLTPASKETNDVE